MNNQMEIKSREHLTADIAAVIKRLRQVVASAEDERGESSGLIVARLGEVHEHLGGVLDSARDWLTTALEEQKVGDG